MKTEETMPVGAVIQPGSACSAQEGTTSEAGARRHIIGQEAICIKTGHSTRNLKFGSVENPSTISTQSIYTTTRGK
jgi:hypothetical protein